VGLLEEVRAYVCDWFLMFVRDERIGSFSRPLELYSYLLLYLTLALELELELELFVVA